MVWLVFTVGAVVAHLNKPERTVTGNYRDAALAFVKSEPMYFEGGTGWLYPVQAAVLWVPFATEPRWIGDVAWRVFNMALLAVAVWRLTRACNPRHPPLSPQAPRHDLFLLVTMGAIPPALSAARNGQTNLLLTALFALTCAEIIRRKWWLATFWICFALAAKPHAIVLLLLFTAVNRPLWKTMPVGLLAVAALPFVHPNWTYVSGQYVDGIRKVFEAGKPLDHAVFKPADLSSLLHLVGLPHTGTWLTGIRALAAVGVLAVCLRARRVLDHPAASVVTLTVGCAYLLPFNPRTEANTYTMIGPGLAMLTAWSLALDRKSRRSIILVAATALMGCAQLFVYRQREYWIRPAETLLILAWLSSAVMVARWRHTIPVQPDFSGGGASEGDGTPTASGSDSRAAPAGSP